MERYKNKPENFIREVRLVEIYQSSAVSFEDCFNGVFPNSEDALFSFAINPENFQRKIPTKTQQSNYFFDSDITISLYIFKGVDVDHLYEKLNKKEFVVVLYTNTDKVLLGNSRESMKVEFIDGVKDDGSGNDEYILSISGDSIINPKIKNL